jgi:cytochrome c
MDFNPKVVSVPINLSGVATDKLQDVYVVYVNPKADGSLMVVMGLEFKLANEGAAIAEPKADANAAPDFFVGKWAAKMIGTPGGDVAIDFIFERTDGKMTGKMVSEKMGSQPIEKIEEIDPEKIKVFFSANGMSINMELSKEDADNFKGKLMGMFDVKANRVK